MIDSYGKYVNTLGLQRGDRVYVSSDITMLAFAFKISGEEFIPNKLIDALIEAVGIQGTLVFPTFNWDFCKQKSFNYNTTPSKTGSLSQAALIRTDFKRTKHPIYSFAVFGADQEQLCSLNNKSAFGEDSPFSYFYNYDYINLLIDVDYQHSSTFVHFCEQKVGVHYRYLKEFTANYIDENSNESTRTYSMYVRNLDDDVGITVNPIHEDFVKNNVVKEFTINGIPNKLLNMKRAYDLVLWDILDNQSKKISKYNFPHPGYTPSQQMYKLALELFPICRSITGNGFRQTLQRIKEELPELSIKQIPSGTKVNDWEIPQEWNISDAYIADMQGNKIIDFKNNNLHVIGYSQAIDKIVTRDELFEMVYTHPELPHAIPYLTSYYKKRSGFCVSQEQKQQFTEEKYRVCIDSTLAPGHLTYGSLLIPGETDEEVLFSTYMCHPSMANNELSGPCLATYIAKWIMEKPRRYSYRILFLPETIGAITYISQNLQEMKKNIVAGYVLTCAADNRTFSFVPSRYGNTLADRVAQSVLKNHTQNYINYTFLNRASDERQYCAPGVDLPVATICRSKYHEYPEYHTSLDNMNLISPEGFEGSYEIYKKCIEVIENNYFYKITCLCEPQLGKRNLYPNLSQRGSTDGIRNMMDFIAYADGTNDLISISNIIGASVESLIEIANKLYSCGLLERL